MKHEFIRDATEAARLLGTILPETATIVEQLYPVQITPYYLNLINRNDPVSDPVWKQCMPDAGEMLDPEASFDPLSEEKQMPVPRLIHRFADRAVLLVTGRCAVKCRFCFRKRTWKTGSDLPDITRQELDDVCSCLKENPQIQEVLVSGGDPLMLSTDRLQEILTTLTSTGTINVIRIGSRIPVTFPDRVDFELVRMLSEFDGIWLMTHFNHPAEVTPESAAACRKFIKAGIPVLNQTVLLRGINDDAVILEALFRKLVRIQVKPHYLFHVDPVKGVRHFATGLEKGLEILREFRTRLSSLAVPTFAIDLPEGGGKVALQPDYRCADGFVSIHGDKIIKYPGPL
ncbi:MAG: KamA family radical SAM protein [Victivallaceae bacterium]